MITVTPIPAASASATTNQLLVQLTEQLCQPFNIASSIQPQSSVTFTAGTATTETVTVGSTTTYRSILPITVTGSIVYIPKGTCRAVTKLFTEKMTVAFVGLSTAPTTFTITQLMQTKEPANVKCCNRAYAYNINTAISITAA